MEENGANLLSANSKIKEAVINFLIGFASHRDFKASPKRIELVTSIANGLGLNGLVWLFQRNIEKAEHITYNGTLNEINKLDKDSKYVICAHLNRIANIDGPFEEYTMLAVTYSKLIGLSDEEILGAPEYIANMMSFLDALNISPSELNTNTQSTPSIKFEKKTPSRIKNPIKLKEYYIGIFKGMEVTNRTFFGEHKTPELKAQAVIDDGNWDVTIVPLYMAKAIDEQGLLNKGICPICGDSPIDIGKSWPFFYSWYNGPQLNLCRSCFEIRMKMQEEFGKKYKR